MIPQLQRLFYRPRSTRNVDGELVAPCPTIRSGAVRKTKEGALEVIMEGDHLVGCANGPQVTIDGQPSPCICFDGDKLVAQLGNHPAPQVRIVVTHGPLVCGDFLIDAEAGARVSWWAIRVDDRILNHQV